MRLSTLILASAFAWVFCAGVALVESQELATPEFDVLEEVTPEPLAEAEAPVADLAPAANRPEDEEAAALDPATDVAEDATPAAEEAPVAWEEDAGEATPVAENEPVSWDDFEDPGFDPSEPVYPAPEPQVPAAQSAASSSSIPLGPMAVDANGVEGRIHTVAKGDTLWDISDAYLGTPWVWPSVWHENDEIENPHVIEPGNRIWITSNEMRRVSEEEADQMIAAVPLADEDTEIASEFEFEPVLEFEDDESFMADEPLPASIEDEPELVAMPIDLETAMTGQIITLPFEQTAHFASVDTMAESSQIVDSPTLRAFLTQGDKVYVALGEGEVSTGDVFTIFRGVEKIRDVNTAAVIGYHFDERGWLEIVAVEGEASTGIIGGATAAMQRGDRLVPRVHTSRDIAIRTAIDDVDASIVFMPGNRWLMGTTDSVYLNVGSIHGIEVGTRMEVYQAGRVTSAKQMPDTVMAQMVVISVEAETSIAFVTQTIRELEIGDHVRTVVNDKFAVR